MRDFDLFFPLNPVASLPRVDVVSLYVGVDAILLRAAIDAGVRGTVLRFASAHELLHHEGPLRRRVGRKEPRGSGKAGDKRSTVVDANGILLGAVALPANHHDPPLLGETLDTLEELGPLPEQMSVHLDRGYDSETTREKLKARGLASAISEQGKPAPLQATKR